MDDVVAILAGVLLAAAGGEMFVRGVVGLASWARVPARVIATTVVAFATSSPEFAVSTSAAIAGKPAVGFGDALGSNVANVGLVLGLALVVAELRVERDATLRDVGVAFAAPVLTGALVLDGRVTRVDGVVLLMVFAGWLARTLRAARRDRTEGRSAPSRLAAALPFAALGLVALALAGRLVATGAKGVGDALGLDAFVVGATMVAVGTSLPELATALTATVRGHHEVGLGTILGSSIFNGLWIIGVTALIEPITVRRVEALVALGFGIVLVAVLHPGRHGRFRRRRGGLLLALYGVYVAVLARTGTAP